MTKRKPKELLKVPRYDHITNEQIDALWKRYIEEELSIKQLSEQTGIGEYFIHTQFKKRAYHIRNREDAIRLAAKQGRMAGSKLGKPRPRPKNGKIIDRYGYVHIRMPENPHACVNGYIREHLLVWETYNNTTLPKGWHIHHVNGNKSDNRIENLLALPKKDHARMLPILYKRIQELEEEVKRLNEELQCHV